MFIFDYEFWCDIAPSGKICVPSKETFTIAGNAIEICSEVISILLFSFLNVC